MLSNTLRENITRLSTNGDAPLKLDASTTYSQITELAEPLQQQSRLVRSSSIKIQAIPEPNNTTSNAHSIGTLSSGQNYSFSDFVGSSDTQDFYRFSLSKISNLNLSLTGLSADADLDLWRLLI